MPINKLSELTEGRTLFQSGLPIYVNRVHETFDTMEHSHDFIEISCVGEGKGTHYIDDQTLTVTQGDIFFIPIGVSHVFRPISTGRDHGLVVYNCVLTKSYFHDLLQSFPDNHSIALFYSDSNWRKFYDSHGRVNLLFQKIFHEYTRRRSYFAAALKNGTSEILLTLYRAETEQDSDDVLSKTSDMDTVLHHLHTHYDQIVLLHDMSELLGVGERQFHRIFKKHTGMHLTEYIQDVRIKKACHMLRTTDLKIQEIAIHVGYQDIKFFNQLFKRKTGVTPRQFRRNLPTTKTHLPV